jgi:hypothetical protein
MEIKEINEERESSSTTPSSNVDSFSRTRQSTMGDSETIKTPADIASNPAEPGSTEAPAKKPNWLVSMIQTQIKTFNIGLLLMATKSHPCRLEKTNP